MNEIPVAWLAVIGIGGFVVGEIFGRIHAAKQIIEILRKR